MRNAKTKYMSSIMLLFCLVIASFCGCGNKKEYSLSDGVYKMAGESEDELAGYKITPKGMLQIFRDQAVPEETLKLIIKETLTC